MKHSFIICLLGLAAITATAQPPARMKEAARTQAQQKQQQAVKVSERAQLEFPSQMAMPEDVAWRRDIYRTLDLKKDRNAVLYYPEEPAGDRMNLFTYLFKLMMRKQITAYNYTIDGNEDFSAANAVVPKDFLDRNHIRYEEKAGKFRIEDSDIPSAEVNAYFIKECTYYDQRTATFHTQVVALCPVRREADDFEVSAVNKPLFWVKYDDIAPFLAKLTLNGSNYNNAATMSADDYFTANQYEGKIYKTNNLQGQVLANYCKDDSALNREQKRIEAQLTTLENNVWGDSTILRKLEAEKAVRDSLRMVKQGLQYSAAPAAKAGAQAAKSERPTGGKSGETSNSSRSQTKRQKSSAAPRQATYSVRRQRH